MKHCDRFVTLECLRALYHFDGYELLAPNINTVGVGECDAPARRSFSSRSDHVGRLTAEFGMNFYNPKDLDTFFRKFAPSRLGHRPKLISIAGGEHIFDLVAHAKPLPYQSVHHGTGRLNESDTDSNDFAETSLDLELMMGLLGPKQEVLLYQTDTSIFNPIIGNVALRSYAGSAPPQ